MEFMHWLYYGQRSNPYKKAAALDQNNTDYALGLSVSD